MTTTARFELQRSKQLKNLFTKKRLVSLWRKLVKNQMRNLDVKDLHDYYDFNYGIESRVDGIIEKILSGLYRAQAPLVYKVEKKLGVCRHMMIPSPSDALVFQVLTDELYEALKKAQPSKGAFYSRDRHTLKLPHEHRADKNYPWFVLWPKFQKSIWKFSKDHKFLVTTDLANYFDNIGLRELRHVISSLSNSTEVYLDLLFSLIEDLSWKPDYLPTSHKGLPTINIEAPRLLAHALLFEVDHVLKEITDDNFVRWMDDIIFGIDQKEQAHIILGQINDVLKSRGLALNLAKTEILNDREAQKHFLFKENLQLTKLHKRAKKLKTEKARQNLANRLFFNFQKHLKTCSGRNRDKVSKRYLTLLGYLKSPLALKTAADLFLENPGMRSNILYYLEKLPFTKLNARQVLRIFDDIPYLDDIAIFRIVESLVRWEIPRNRRGTWFVKEVFKRLENILSAFGWLCWAHFSAKYGEPHQVLNVISSMKKFGAREAFFSRQAMAILPRALGINKRKVLDSWSKEISTGSSDSASVASNLSKIWRSSFPAKNNRLSMYLFPRSGQKPYPIAKFLLLCILSVSDRENKKSKKRQEVINNVTDPWYRHWLMNLNPDWF